MDLYDVVTLPGDGVGPELVNSGKTILNAISEKYGSFAFRYQDVPFGQEPFRAYGKAIPAGTLEAVKSAQSILMGALDASALPSPSPVGFLRRELGLYADVRPAKSYAGAASVCSDLDIVCIRESTQGFLADRNLARGYGEFSPVPGQVLSLRVITQEACERIVRFAFDYAVKNNRKKVTALHKANVLKMGCGLFLDTFRRIAQEYPQIVSNDVYVDTAAGDLISSPRDYDVLVTTNLFGDIISDELTALAAGLVPTGNYNGAQGFFMAMNHAPHFEIAGTDRTDPMSMILCCGMLLEHVGQAEAANALREAVKRAVSEGALQLDTCSAKVAAVCRQL